MDGGITFWAVTPLWEKMFWIRASSLGSRNSWCLSPPSCDWARGGVHPGEGPDRERQKTTQSQIPGFKLLLFEVLIGKDTHELSHERTS